MIDKTIQDYSQTLTDMGIENSIVEHPSLRDPQEVQSRLGLTLADGLSTMLMKAGDNFIVILRRCDTRLDSKKLKKLVGTNKVRMANPDEYNDLTGGLPLGAARIFNPGLHTYLDEQLFDKEYLTSGSGSFTCSITVKAEDLKKLPNSEIAALCQE